MICWAGQVAALKDPLSGQGPASQHHRTAMHCAADNARTIKSMCVTSFGCTQQNMAPPFCSAAAAGAARLEECLQVVSTLAAADCPRPFGPDALHDGEA